MFIVFAGGAGGFSFAQTSKSFMFLGRLKTTIGGSGMAFFSLLEVWRIGRCFFATRDRLVSPGWYVTTNGIRLVGCLCGSGLPYEAALMLFESANPLLLSGIL